jgi:hypothetical protein
MPATEPGPGFSERESRMDSTTSQFWTQDLASSRTWKRVGPTVWIIRPKNAVERTACPLHDATMGDNPTTKFPGRPVFPTRTDVEYGWNAGRFIAEERN